MSTRGTLFYVDLHIYHECLDDWIYIQIDHGLKRVCNFKLMPIRWFNKVYRIVKGR